MRRFYQDLIDDGYCVYRAIIVAAGYAVAYLRDIQIEPYAAVSMAALCSLYVVIGFTNVVQFPMIMV